MGCDCHSPLRSYWITSVTGLEAEKKRPLEQALISGRRNQVREKERTTKSGGTEKSSTTKYIAAIIVVILVGAITGAYLLTNKPTATITTSSICTPVPILTQVVSLSNATSPVTLKPGTYLVFPLPVPFGRMDPHISDNFTVSAGGPIEVAVYNSTNYSAFETGYDSEVNSSSATDTGASSVPHLFSSGFVNSGSFTYNLPGGNGTFYLVDINNSLVNSLTFASSSNLVWALPSC